MINKFCWKYMPTMITTATKLPLFIPNFNCHYLFPNSIAVIYSQIPLPFIPKFNCRYLFPNSIAVIYSQIQLPLFIPKFNCHYLFPNSIAIIYSQLQLPLFIPKFNYHYLFPNSIAIIYSQLLWMTNILKQWIGNLMVCIKECTISHWWCSQLLYTNNTSFTTTGVPGNAMYV